MSTQKIQIIKKIDEYERLGLFDQPVQPHNPDLVKPMTDDYKYLRSNIFSKITSTIAHGIVRLASLFFAKNVNLKIVGKQNLKGIKSAIVTCNHVNNVDCTFVTKAIRNHRVYYTVSPINNKKGFGGYCLRRGGILPFGTSVANTKNMSRAIAKLLDKKAFILFYPEAELWWNYKKPRPYKKGAYYYAVTNNVPIVPMFITFKQRNKKSKDGIPKYDLTLHVMPAIYPNPNFLKQDNINNLMHQNFLMCKDVYEKFYKTNLSYTTTPENRKQLDEFLNYKAA